MFEPTTVKSKRRCSHGSRVAVTDAVITSSVTGQPTRVQSLNRHPPGAIAIRFVR